MASRRFRWRVWSSRASSPRSCSACPGRCPSPTTAREVLRAVAWIAAGFEIVQSHFPDWKFTAADCTAAFGLHGALVVGTPLPVTAANRDALAELLPRFELTLRRGDEVIDRGLGSNVLGSPALALAHLAGVLAGDRDAAPLEAGELVTTGTVTDAWPVAPGQTWMSDYGALGIEGLRLTTDLTDRAGGLAPLQEIVLNSTGQTL